jgi:DNA-binding response OmpR family regulator
LGVYLNLKGQNTASLVQIITHLLTASGADSVTGFMDAPHLLTRPKVLIIEDDEDVGRALVGTLDRSGITTCWATSGKMGLQHKANFSPDVILVDLSLPDIDGMRLVELLAKLGGYGIIIVSGLTSETDRIVGLELGADDYITKPVHARELLARIRAVHRRVRMQNTNDFEQGASAVARLGKLRIDLPGRQVYAADGAHISLTAAEFAVLETLVTSRGRPVSRDELSQAALRRPWCAADRGVDQLIFSLRTKLGEEQFLIRSIRGAGYELSADVTNKADVF